MAIKKYKPTKSASTTAVMPDALMTELTPMEHSQNIVGSCSFRVLGRTLPSSVPGKLPGSTAQDGSPHKKRRCRFPAAPQ